MSNTSTDDEDDGTIFRETPTLEEIEKFRPKARNDMLISGWDDQDENIEVERNPHGTLGLIDFMKVSQKYLLNIMYFCYQKHQKKKYYGQLRVVNLK